MLAYVLSIAVGIGSLAIYLAAFFFPEIHRKNDFIWSGIGLFYALVLLVFAPVIQGGLLLGHLASVILLIWLGGETLLLRRQLTPEVKRTPVPSLALLKISIQEVVQKQLSPTTFRERLGQLSTAIAQVFRNLPHLFRRTVPQKLEENPPVSILENLNETKRTVSQTVSITEEIAQVEEINIAASTVNSETIEVLPEVLPEVPPEVAQDTSGKFNSSPDRINNIE